MTAKDRQEVLKACITRSLAGVPEEIRGRILSVFDRRPTTQQLAELQAGIARLPTAQRRVFTLRYVYEMDAQAIAERTGLSIEAVERELAMAFVTVRLVMQPTLDQYLGVASRPKDPTTQ